MQYDPNLIHDSEWSLKNESRKDNRLNIEDATINKYVNATGNLILNVITQERHQYPSSNGLHLSNLRYLGQH